MKLTDLVNFTLVFTAVTLSVYLAVSTIYKLMLEKAEDRRSVNEEISRFISAQKLLTIRFFGALFAGVGIAVILLLCGVLNAFIYIPVGCAAAFVAAMAPLFYFRWKVAQRKELFENKILDLTMGLVSGMKSGLGLPQALEAVSKRIGGVMQEELQTVLREYRFGMELSEALQRLHDRMPGEDMHLLVTTIKLTTKTGGSLVEVMDKMSEMIRGRREFQDKLKAMTAQGKFEAIAMSLAPLFVFILLFLIDRPLMLPLVTTVPGWITIAFDTALVTVGFLIIRKIVTIEV